MLQESNLFDYQFKGALLQESDLPRLNTNARRIWDAMQTMKYQRSDGFVDLVFLSEELGIPHSSLSACVRAFRYPENGAHTVLCKRLKDDGGTFVYKLEPNTPEGVKKSKEQAAWQFKLKMNADEIIKELLERLNHAGDLLSDVEQSSQINSFRQSVISSIVHAENFMKRNKK